VWIRNSKGEFLISRRSADRSKFPMMYECVGGSALAGEDSLAAALRETKEEVGVDLDKSCGRVVFSVVGREINGKKFSDILDVWVFDYDGAVDLMKATTDEVCELKWMSVREIKELMTEGKLVYTLEYFFEKIAPAQFEEGEA
jgi:8-oxo-dGTP pyrophosphatase MutT (NUDIX family)